MTNNSIITGVKARQVFADRGYPGVETTVTTADGSSGIAVVTAGVSVGQHEIQFVNDGGEKWNGKGVMKAVQNVTDILGPAVIGLDASRQHEVDEMLIKLDGTSTKSNLGGNATGSVSAAALQAGAASLGIPLYQHIGGVNACTMPVPGVILQVGSQRYGGGKLSGGKPSYSYICYGFESFSNAAYAAWELQREYFRLVEIRFGITSFKDVCLFPSGVINHDRELWDLMVEAIANRNYEGRIGIQMDVAAATYFNKDTNRFEGLFSCESKTREDLMKLYHDAVREYPFVIIEDPLDEIDYEGHADLTKDLGIQIVGDDLFTTNIERLRHGIKVGAANAMLLKVYQIGTITEAFISVDIAYKNGYNVMPCESRGEGSLIADYAVGLGTGHLREGAIGPTGNRLLEIEEELGNRAVFPGIKALKPN